MKKLLSGLMGFLIVLSVLSTLPFQVKAEGQLEITVVPSPVAIQAGHSKTFTVHMDSTYDFEIDVYLWLVDVSPPCAPPMPFTYSFDPSMVHLSAGGDEYLQLTVSIGSDAVPGGYWCYGFYFQYHYLTVGAEIRHNGQFVGWTYSDDIEVKVFPLLSCFLTVTSLPIDGVEVAVDGYSDLTTYVKVFWIGSTLSISAPPSISDEMGTYSFDRWTDDFGFSSSSSTTTYTVPSEPAVVLTAEYAPEAIMHEAVSIGLGSVTALKDGVIDGANIVDFHLPGVAIETAKTLVGFLTPLIPTTDVLIYDIVSHGVITVAAGELLEGIKDAVDIDTFYELYTTGEFSATMEYWQTAISETNDIFQDNAAEYSTDIAFISDMRDYHEYVYTLGNSFADYLNDIVEAHEWEEFGRDLVFLTGGIAIVIVTWGAATPLVVAVEVTYNGVTGIFNIAVEKDFQDTLVHNLRLQEVEALYHAQRVTEGIQYLADKLDSDDLSFPQLSFASIPGGGVWITNEYNSLVKAKLIHSVTLICDAEQTIEPPMRHYEIPYGEFTIAPETSMLFIPYAEPPQDIIEWRDHLESFGYSISEGSSLTLYYGENGYHAMKTIPTPTTGEETLLIQVHSPVNILVTTPDSLRIGYNPGTGTFINEIQGAVCSGPGTEPQVVTIPYTLPGVYIVDVFGTGSGDYTVTIESVATNGSIVDMESWTGTTSLGELDRNDFQLSEDGSTTQLPPSIDVITPTEGMAMQDGATLEATVSDPTGVNWVTFSIREPDGTIIDSMFESMDATDVGNDLWQLWIDTNIPELPDGHYLLLVNASDMLGNEGSETVEFSVDNRGPLITVSNPPAGWALQDGVTFMGSIVDSESGVSSMSFSIREANGGEGIPIGFEDLPVSYNPSTGEWSFSFDTLLVPDGYYVLYIEAADNLGNEANATIPYSIRNWAVLELLPASENNKAGRTMPVKFALRVAAVVDPLQPFVYNEELIIDVYASDQPDEILQESTFGDHARDYRINSLTELYITNFRTLRTPKEYRVEVYRKDMLIDWFTFETVK